MSDSMSAKRAAALLWVRPLTFSRSLRRHAVSCPDGALEARFDGVHARELDAHWRVRLDVAWLASTTPR